MAVTRASGLGPEAMPIAEQWAAGRPGDMSVSADQVTRSWWRQPNEAFARYDVLWPSFARELADLTDRLEAAGHVPAPISACELSYLNPVTAEEDWHRHGQLEQVLLRWLGTEVAGEHLPAPDDVVANATFRFDPQMQRSGGTLTVTLESIAHEGPEPLMGMTLRAQGVVEGPGLGPAGAFFDTAFEWIIRGYASLAPLSPEQPRLRLRAPRRRPRAPRS